jgi:multidrug efflux pump subunit AcrA (membrane-fusion protein)
VEVGAASGGRVPVLSGLEPGEHVVTEGVFFLRAETERLRGGH